MAISSFLQPTELLTLDAIREKLTAPRTYYVDPAGDDNNDGLSAITPFATGQKACDVIMQKIDLAGQPVTVQFAAGTYADTLAPGSFLGMIRLYGVVDSALGYSNPAAVTFVGDPATPSNVVLEIGQDNKGFDIAGLTTAVTIDGFTIDMLGAATNISCGFSVYDPTGLVFLRNIRFEPTNSSLIFAGNNSKLEITGDVDIVAGAHWNLGAAWDGGEIYQTGGTIEFLTGTHTFGSDIFQAFRGGRVEMRSVLTVTGTVTGRSFSAITDGVVRNLWSPDQVFPGDVAGIAGDAAWLTLQQSASDITGLEYNGKLGGGGGGGGRELLTADRNYYVDPTLGNDANDGLSAGAGAFATIQKAVDVASLDLDLQRYKAVINLADDTYSEPRVQLRGLVGEKNAIDLMGVIHIKGNETTPTNVIVQNGMIAESPDAWYMVSGIYFHNTSGNHTCLKAEDGGMIGYASVNFGDAGAFGIHMWTQNHGTIMPCGGMGVPYAVSGSAGSHMYAYKDSYCSAAGAEITFSGTPTFGSFGFLRAIDLGKIDFRVFSLLGTPGAVVGRRFYMEFNSQIATYFEIDGIPGDSTGFMHNSCWMGNYSLFTGTNIETLTANRAISEVIDCRTQVYLNTTSTLDVSLPDGGSVLYDYLREYVIVNRPTSTFPLLLKDDGGTLLATIAPGFQAAAVYDPVADVWITI